MYDSIGVVDLIGGGLTPLEGGHSGETFLAEAAGERSVVRIYAGRSARRGHKAAEVDAAVLRLVRGLVPVPEVLEVRRADEAAGTPALLVTSYLPGTRLDLLLPEASTDQQVAIGRNLGLVLSRLSQMPMLRGGMFVDGDLTIGDWPPGGAYDLVEWVKANLDGTPLEEWPTEDREGLFAVVESAQTLLDTVDRVCLVHSDFNPKNILVDPTTGSVTGLLDWEFAHAGSPFTDLGNLLRFDRRPDLADAVLRTYGESVPDAPADPGELLARARAADLFALVELASRRDENPVTRKAHELLSAMARTGDLHTEPD